MVLGKAEVWAGDSMECTFQIARISTTAEVKDRLTEECIAWVTQRTNENALQRGRLPE